MTSVEPYCRQPLVIDPELFLAGEVDMASWHLIRDVFHHWDRIQLVHDEGEALKKRYGELVNIVQHQGMRARLHRLMQYFDEGDPGLLSRPIVKSPKQDEILVKEGCNEPVEPEMLLLGADAALLAWVCVVGDSDADLLGPGQESGWKVRGVDSRDHRTNVCQTDEFAALQVYGAKDARSALNDWLEHASVYVYPSTPFQLEDYLRRFWKQECDYIELKQPTLPSGRPPLFDRDGNPSPPLTPSILHAAMEAVCAFANVHSGTVIIGVNPAGETAGFMPSYWNQVTQSYVNHDLDRLHQLLTSYLVKIVRKDDQGQLGRLPVDACRVAPIPLKNRRVVMVIKVQGQRGTRAYPYAYYGRIYERDGTSNRSRRCPWWTSEVWAYLGHG